MRIGETQHFPGKFRRGIRRNGTQFSVGLGERNALGNSIDRTGGAEDELGHMKLPTQVEQIQSARNIHALIKRRIVERWPNSGASREMNNNVWPETLEYGMQSRLVANVPLDKLEGARTPHLGKVFFLALRRVKIIELVNNRQRGTSTKEGFRHMRTDKSRPAGQKNSL